MDFLGHLVLLLRRVGDLVNTGHPCSHVFERFGDW